MKTLAIISVATFLVSVVVAKINGIKNDKNVWELKYKDL